MDFSEAVLLKDDSFYARFSDGRVLQLSPCSSTYLFTRPSCHPASVQQYTRFAVSEFRKSVVAAVTFRNQFAERPYVCKELLDDAKSLVNYDDASTCAWPVTIIPDFVAKEINGSVKVHSLDRKAQLLLAPHRQSFTVGFLAQISSSSRAPASKGSDLAQQPKYPHLYTWIEQGPYSVHDYPDCWHFPLQIAFNAHDSSSCYGDSSSCYGDSSSTLPQSLPTTCQSSHLHKWKQLQVRKPLGTKDEESFWQPDVKVIWRDGHIFRVCKGAGKGLQVEIYPSDGMALSSTSLSGKFFTMWSMAAPSSDQRVEKVLSVDKPPQDRPGDLYSLARLIKQGSRLLEFISRAGNPRLSPEPCWKTKVCKQLPLPFVPPTLIETADIGVGRFKAYSNGRFHIVFADRTVLDVTHPPHAETCHQEDLQFCFVLPDGSMVQCTGGAVEGLERYVQLAYQWRDWTISSPEQRRAFYKNTVWDHEASSAVDAEICKLKVFNYMVSSDVRADDGILDDENSKENSSTVNNVLTRNSRTIQDIERLLQDTKKKIT
ncbi:uncharacterized protein C5orf34-like isoform X3 [Nematostella vectensis]|uniref:uncharacterized protein C5orf34-like isoform X3 n=1 Tax=Nematostella vectensis TaxID=45351 RepID=UPI0020775D70|nr:uncharacterized protein C5orf34-like isoform X3 [Nematostella vectensis]